VEELSILRPPELVADLGLSVVSRAVYSTGILQIWYLTIDIHFILFHVEFEDRLSTTVLNNRATRPRNSPLEIEKILKKVKSPAHFISHPAFFELS
jgi:hypothetical protein